MVSDQYWRATVSYVEPPHSSEDHLTDQSSLCSKCLLPSLLRWTVSIGLSKMRPEDRDTRTGIHIVSSLGGPSLMIILQLLSGHLPPQRSHSLGSTLPPLATIFPVLSLCHRLLLQPQLSQTVSCTGSVMRFRGPGQHCLMMLSTKHACS